MSMVRFNLVIAVDSQNAAEDVLVAFRHLMGGVRIEPGCLGCSAWLDSDSAVRYTEDWATEADLRRHVQSLSFVPFLELMETSVRPPLVEFHFMMATRRLDYLDEIRAGRSH